MSISQQDDRTLGVAAVVTAMTDKEEPFVHDTVKSVLSDEGIVQVVLCIEEKNTWIESALGLLSTDNRLEIIRLPLAPPGAVRNEALKFVHTPWVAYCDGDDVWCKGKTLTQKSYFINSSNCDFVGADHYLTNDSGKIRAFATARYLPMPSSWMVKTEVMLRHPFNESIYEGECGEWWARTHGTVRKVRCPKMLLRYRIRASSLSAATPSMGRKAKIVRLGDIPVAGQMILLASWCIWFFSRQNEYIWYDGWTEPAERSPESKIELDSKISSSK